MSEDLLSYFILKGCGLSKEDRRSILLANRNAYERKGIEQSLRVSFHDLHEREKKHAWPQDTRRPHPRYSKRSYHVAEDDEEAEEAFYEGEDGAEESYDHEEDWEAEEAMQAISEDVGEEPNDVASNCGASEDQEVYEAYVAMDKHRGGYQQARRRLREVQKSRGFYKAPGSDDRQALVNQEKQRSRCGACHKFGHWARYPICPKSSSTNLGKSSSKGKRGKSGKSKGRGRAAYMVSSEPAYCNLGDLDEDELQLVMEDDPELCYMVHGVDSEEERMVQDAGYTEQDDKRKKPATSYAESEWDKISEPPMPGVMLWRSETTSTTPTGSRLISSTHEEVIRPTVTAQIETLEVESLNDSRPQSMKELKVYQLQELCNKWGIQTTGSKQDLKDRLETFCRGEPVPKKNCAMKFIRLVEEANSSEASKDPKPSGIFGTVPATSKASAAASSADAPEEFPRHPAMVETFEHEGLQPTPPWRPMISFPAGEHVSALVAKEEEIKVDARAENALRAHHQLKESSGVNESRSALVDPALTSCMHSQSWRIEYSKSLPPGYECMRTEHSKVLNFADGSSTSTRAPCGKFQNFLGNRPGFVHSAEVGTGTTPLLLSIASLVALDAILFMRRKIMRVEELQMDLELVETGTKHLAVRVAYDEHLSGVLANSQDTRVCKSVNDDLFVYLGQERILSHVYRSQTKHASRSRG